VNSLNLIFAITISALIIYLGISESEQISIPNFYMNDKLVHLICYFFLYLVWHKPFVYFFNDNALIYLFIFSLTFSILIELGQKYLTLTRNAELLDIVFNWIGIQLAYIYFNLKKRKI
jgi:VanZ family protein